MLLTAQNIKKGYGIRELFEIEKLEIQEGDRIGLVGLNGAGKSTLLHILYGSEQPDVGQIRSTCPIAMIEQFQEADWEADPTLISRLNLKGSAVKSGGEKTRMKIAAALSGGTKLLFADEPTTNLDLKGVRMLEKMLQDYRGAFVLISHDRYLLDKLCTSIWEIEDGKLRCFPGTYSMWREQKQREREFAQFEFEQYRTEKRRMETAIHQVKSEASQMLKPPRQMGHSEWMLYKGVAKQQQGHVESRGKAMERRLSHLEVKEKPKELPPLIMRLGSERPLTGKNAVKVSGLTVAYERRKILDQVDFELKTNRCTVLQGDNGAGKTTLIRSILNEDSHAVFLPDVKIGYFSQEHETLDEEKTVLENVRQTSDKKEHLIRCILANLYLTERDIEKPVSVLSGGERAKVMLAKLMASDVNVLILDEPTNHIDMYTAEALQELLKKWEGTLLLVTHDRKLAQDMAERLAFLENGRLSCFEGSWEAWQEEEQRKKIPNSSKTLDKTLLGMKMAELSQRLQRPRKGDQVLKIREELEKVTKEYYRS